MFDAFLLLSFGGPEHRDDVMPFLRNVTAGRGIPDERLAEVAEHYYHFGGVSPINDQNKALMAALQQDFADHGIDIPIYWGNRNWHPFLTDTTQQMRDDGIKRVFAVATSGYSSYSACRQYLDDIAAAREAVPGAPEIVKAPPYYAEPGFLAAHAEALRGAIASLTPQTRVVFVAHSIPLRMHEAAGGAYETQLRAVAAQVFAAAAPDSVGWDLVWQSRSGAPSTPWLEPDINDHLEVLAAQDVHDVVVSPIGFVSDHLEVKWDLDEEAAETASRLGMKFARAATPGTHPAFVGMIRDLTARALAGEPVQPCTAGCCS